MKNIAGMTPINKTAALVTGKGFEYKSNIRSVNTESRNPLKTKKIPYSTINQNGFIDFTGVRFARFTVIGMYANGRGWVARCDCGVYCIRQAKSIKNIENIQDRCQECKHLAFLKRSEVARRTGKDVHINKF